MDIWRLYSLLVLTSLCFLILHYANNGDLRLLPSSAKLFSVFYHCDKNQSTETVSQNNSSFLSQLALIINLKQPCAAWERSLKWGIVQIRLTHGTCPWGTVLSFNWCKMAQPSGGGAPFSRLVVLGCESRIPELEPVSSVYSSFLRD